MAICIGQIDKEDLKPRLLNPVYKYSKLQKSQEEAEPEHQKQCGFC